MNQIATITSKLQLTLPIGIARKVGVQSGEKVDVLEEEGRIIITPLRKLVEELAGSIQIPASLQRKDVDTLIQQAKKEYFRSKYRSKKK